jgi:hypothetical protein
VAARELIDEGADVGLAAQRQGGQLEPGGPAFGAVAQCRYGRLGQLDPDRHP